MSRNKKNIIMGVLLILLLASSFFTINYIKNHENFNDFNKSMKEESPPNMTNDESNSGEPPERPSNDTENKQPTNVHTNNSNLKTIYYVILTLESLAISLTVIYLITSNFNKKGIKEVFKTGDKITIFILSNILLTGILTVSSVAMVNYHDASSNEFKEQVTTKDEVNLDKNTVVEEGDIDLNQYDSDITITKGGTYTFSGNLKHSIVVNADKEDVEIVLNGVTIETESTATIVGLAANKITIITAERTENILSDGGNSSYDGCIFSNAELVFEGKGKLIVNGNQNEGEGIATEAQNITINSGTIIITSNDDGVNAGGDGATITINGGTIYIDASGDGIDSNKDAVINGGTLFVMGSDTGGDSGIDTDDGFVINGGLVVALGTDMIETPEDNSKQTTIAFSLNEKIDKDTLVTLMKDDEVVISFEATKSFKTIIISSNTLTNGDYALYKGGKNTGTLEYGIYKNGEYTKGDSIKVNNLEVFTISKTINTFGSTR
mgnify:CR=1 FL=1